MNFKINNVEEYLRSHGIKPSFQRIRVFDYLITNRNHPTVDMIYQELSKEIPTLSKTTVYNTLKLFVEKEITLLLTIEEGQARFDADTSLHGHFKCEQCAKVYDFDVAFEQMKISELERFQINENHVYFKGICEDCLKK